MCVCRVGIYRVTCFPEVGSLVDDGVGRLVKEHPHARAISSLQPLAFADCSCLTGCVAINHLFTMRQQGLLAAVRVSVWIIHMSTPWCDHVRIRFVILSTPAC